MLSPTHLSLLRLLNDTRPAADPSPVCDVAACEPAIEHRGYSLLLDCETLALGPGAVITEFAAIAFCRNTLAMQDYILLKIDPYAQLAAGREVDPGTIAFHARNRSLPTDGARETPFYAAASLQRFICLYQPRRVWIQGTDFDRPLLENFFRQLGQPLPWDYGISRDARTTWDLAFPDVRHPKRPHNALDDCLATLADLKAAITKLDAFDSV